MKELDDAEKKIDDLTEHIKKLLARDKKSTTIEEAMKYQKEQEKLTEEFLELQKRLK